MSRDTWMPPCRWPAHPPMDQAWTDRRTCDTSFGLRASIGHVREPLDDRARPASSIGPQAIQRPLGGQPDLRLAGLRPCWAGSDAIPTLFGDANASWIGQVIGSSDQGGLTMSVPSVRSFWSQVRSLLEDYNDKKDAELQAWVRDTRRREAARDGTSAEASDMEARWHLARAARLRLELASLYDRAASRPVFPVSRRRRRRNLRTSSPGSGPPPSPTSTNGSVADEAP